ncbi:MAG: hypothetical protein RL563_2385 [Pseudomonadota bacterium]
MKDNVVLFAQWLLALKHFRRSPRYYSPIASGARRSTAFVQRLKWLFVQLLLGFLLSSVLLVAGLRFLSPPTTAFMLHTHIDDLVAAKTYRAIDQRWVDATHISKYASLAVVASEDQLFYQHFGFDMDAIYRAYDRYQRGGKLRGASTISQQVAKNLFLSPARNLGRKVFEVWFTLLIEILWSKQRILEMYLNIAEFGDHLYGIEAASQHFFKLPAKQLSAPQAALLAATLPNPRLLRADRPSAFLGRRQQWILGQMRHLSPAS